MLAERVQAETGLPAGRVAGETARTVGQLRLFASVVRDGGWRQVRIDTPDPDRSPLPRPDLRQRSVPIGPVAVFGASNFPLAFSVAGGDTASALAAGCPVIVKGHPAHPGTSELVGRAIRDAVRRARAARGHLLAAAGHHARAGHAPWSPTPGSRRSASPARAAAVLRSSPPPSARPEPIPVYAEMSSVNPVFVLPGALADRARPRPTAYVGVGDRQRGAAVHASPACCSLSDGPDVDDFVQAAAAAVVDTVTAPMLTAGDRARIRRGRSRRSPPSTGVMAVAEGSRDPDVARAGSPRLFVTDR